MNIILIGPQSSGKGTQAYFLSKKLNIPVVTTGDFLRKKKKSGDEEAKLLASYMDSGELVPDELVDKIVKEELLSDEYKAGVVLDGYPRNEHQKDELEKYFKIDKVIFLDVPDGIVVKRMAARRVCEKCHENYNLDSKPPKETGKCDACGGTLIQREDDTGEATAVRLNIYHKETEPLIEYYKSQGKLISVDGKKSIEEVHEEIMEGLA